MFRLLSLLVTCMVFQIGLTIVQVIAGSARKRGQVPSILAEMHRVRALIILRIIGVSVSVNGERSIDPGSLLVSNHLSYLDILIISSIFPADFVAKSEVAGWPLIGWMARLGGTLFLERGNTSSNVGCFYRVCDRLRGGNPVAVFPEGTTTDGTESLLLHPFFLAAAIRCARPILPLRIDHCRVGHGLSRREEVDLFCWYGNASFLPHFWRLLEVDSIEVSLTIHPKIETNRSLDAHHLGMIIEKQLQPDDRMVDPRNQSAEMSLETDEEISIDFLAAAVLFSLPDWWNEEQTEVTTLPALNPACDEFSE